MVTIATEPQQNDGISQKQFSWFTTFLIAYEIEAKRLNLRCIGCRELVKPDYKKPSHILGVIEFDGLYIPVIDPGILLLSKPTPLNNLSCILITPHRWQYQQYHTGIVIKDVDEIMEFASAKSDIEPLRNMSVNMKFVLDIRKSPGAESWLYENHQMLEICRNESQREQDYLAFKHICSSANSVI
jgi:chemotaxis signal transduction protein